MRRLAVVLVAAFVLAVPAATAKTSRNFTFQSSGAALVPGSQEDFPFTIRPDEENGAFSVGLKWTNPADDWDLYVYQRINGQLEEVGSSAGGAPSTEEQATVQGQLGRPVEPGQYVISVVNFAAADPNFEGVTKFTTFTPPNRRPRVKLRVRPKKASSRRRVRISAKGSKDPDGRIVSFAFDLDGNGSMETVTGKRRVIKRRFKPGFRHISVRATDDDGARTYANATVAVYKPKPRRRR